MSSRCASADNREIRSHRAKLNTNHTRSHVRDKCGNHERRNLARSAFDQLTAVLLDGIHTADSRTDKNAYPVRIFLIHIQARIRKRFFTGSKSEVDETVISSGCLRIHVIRRVEILDFAADLTGKFLSIEGLDLTDTILAVEESLEKGFNIQSDRSDRS